ncbi:MAG: hypothetical protein ACLSHU_07150 [Oscillospiraceae bacterium]
MTDERNRLYLRYRAGEAAHKGQLEDYAVYTLALLELYRASFDAAYLEEAIFRADQMVDLFEDRDRGGYFITPRDGEQLIARPKEVYDGAIPSGNSAAAMALQALADLTGEVRWREAAHRQLRFLAGAAAEHPIESSFGLLAIAKALSPTGSWSAPQPRAFPGAGGLPPDEGRRGSVRSGQDGGERGPAGPVRSLYGVLSGTGAGDGVLPLRKRRLPGAHPGL